MARGRFREPAIVEPEPYYEPGEQRGALAPFILGLVLGFVGLALWLGLPTLLDGARSIYETNVLPLVPEDYQQYAIYGVWALVILFVLLVRHILLRIPLILGVIIGALIWVPFGNHMMAYVPQIEENLPDLRVGIDGLLVDYPQLQSLRDLAETNLAVPGAVEGS